MLVIIAFYQLCLRSENVNKKPAFFFGGHPIWIRCTVTKQSQLGAGKTTIAGSSRRWVRTASRISLLEVVPECCSYWPQNFPKVCWPFRNPRKSNREFPIFMMIVHLKLPLIRLIRDFPASHDCHVWLPEGLPGQCSNSVNPMINHPINQQSGGNFTSSQVRVCTMINLFRRWFFSYSIILHHYAKIILYQFILSDD